MGELAVRLDDGLRVFLAGRHRRLGAGAADDVVVAYDGTSSVGHVVESVGVPLTEVGGLEVDGRPVGPSFRPGAGAVVSVLGVRRPQTVPEHRFLLDVHLGTPARWLRVVGVDAAYKNDRDDDALIAWANAERRVLLTQDRGLLCRRSLWLGAYVRGARPKEQFEDVLERFAPPLAPWTRCTACNGRLAAVPKERVAPALRPGTRRSYDAFARCAVCARVYWRGAHGARLAALVTEAERIVSTASITPHKPLNGIQGEISLKRQ
ncbi:Mut7-C RNAse domain-containing protein [Sphaerisporangium sp. NPDC005289]|uniref:Mut7-C RNAse domain-containing protein n=1 Tax=Sphaerisporangium sp. NPDC005289 TaxID=3155247 RepID=UPI0033B62F73